MTNDQDRERRRAWSLANPEKVKASKRAHYQKHRQRELLKAKERYKRDKRLFIDRAAARYKTHRQEILSKKRNQYAQDPTHFTVENQKYLANLSNLERSERYRKYRLSFIDRNPDRYKSNERSKRQKRRAVLAGVFMEKVVDLTVFQRDKGRCGICGLPVPRDSDWHIDHVVPLSKGGVHSYDNVQLAHARCNLSKSDKIKVGQIGLFQKIPANHPQLGGKA